MIAITKDVRIDPAEIRERFVRAYGPAGTNQNKAATAVQLRFNLNRSSLPTEVKARLQLLAGTHITRGGDLVVDSRIFKSQSQNRTAARRRLLALLKRASTPRLPRVVEPPPAESQELRLSEKHTRGAIKKRRMRVRT